MELQFETVGHGPLRVIAIHDWMSTIRSYDDARPYLDESSFTYAFVDMRGYGCNRKVTGRNDVQEAASDVLNVADRLRWQAFNLIGHSMSGMIAQRVCVQAPARVKSLVAVTPVTASGMPLNGEALSLFRGAANEDDKWLAVAGMVTSGRLPRRAYQAKLRQFRDSVDREAFTRFLDMWTRTDFSAEMKDLSMPALAILGRHDIPAFGEAVIAQTLGRWFSGLKLEIIEGSGHYPMTETPPYFVKQVEDFMASAA